MSKWNALSAMSNTTAMVFSFPSEPTARIRKSSSKENLSSVQLDNDPSFVYSAGDTVTGTYETFVDHPFGVLAVLDGTISTVVRDIYGRKRTDTVTNLQKCTYIVKSPIEIPRKKMLFSVGGTHTYRFSIRIPHANLPGTFLGENGKIEYRLLVIEDRDIPYRFVEKPIFLKSYFNLFKLKSLDDLATTQIWQTKKMQYVSSIFSGSGKTCKSHSSCQESYLELTHRNPDLKTVLTISKTCFIPGESIHFEIRTDVKNASSSSKAVVVVVSLLLRIIYTAARATVTTRKSCRVKKCSKEQSWSDQITIPADLEIASSMSAKVQPIIFQYYLRLEVSVEGGEVEPLQSGELLIVIGTTRNPGHPDPENLILDIAKCEYPIGFTGLRIPADWDRLCKTGGFGYFESGNSQVVPIVSSPSPISSQFESVETRSLRSESSVAPSLPAYSTLSSRRTSWETLPPTYEALFEDQIEIEDAGCRILDKIHI